MERRRGSEERDREDGRSTKASSNTTAMVRPKHLRKTCGRLQQDSHVRRRCGEGVGVGLPLAYRRVVAPIQAQGPDIHAVVDGAIL